MDFGRASRYTLLLSANRRRRLPDFQEMGSVSLLAFSSFKDSDEDLSFPRQVSPSKPKYLEVEPQRIVNTHQQQHCGSHVIQPPLHVLRAIEGQTDVA